jgi:hypothetical protein
MLIVRAVGFNEDSIELSFAVMPDDLRDVAGHHVMQMRTFVLSRSGAAYADEIKDLVQAADALVADVLEDWFEATPVVDDDDELDEELGMGQG